MTSDMTQTLLSLLGQSSRSPVLVDSLSNLKIRHFPQTIEEVKADLDEDIDNDDEDEVTRRSQDSQIVNIEKYGLALIYKTKREYETIYGSAPNDGTFVLHEIAFYAAGVRGALAYPGMLPYGLNFAQDLQSHAPVELGSPLAQRRVYDVFSRLYMPQEYVINVSFDHQTGQLLHVHVRKQGLFDRCQQRKLSFPFTDERSEFYTKPIGQFINTSEVQAVFEKVNIELDKRDSAGCPEEINDAEISHGVTLHIRGPKEAGIKTSLGESVVFVLAGVVLKRQGDQASQGYFGRLPLDLGFWMTPEQAREKVPFKTIWEHQSDQLMSLMWRLENGQLLQAMFSLIDWQLYRVSTWAPFMAQEFQIGGLSTVAAS